MASAKEKAQEIRNELKTLGYGRKQVSVRSRPVTYSSAIDVTVKALGVDIEKVEEIANKAKSVRYCEVSGEVLMGGNTYVSVQYAHELDEAFAELAKDLDFESKHDVKVTDDILASWDEQRGWQFWKMHGSCGHHVLTVGTRGVRQYAGRFMNEAACKAVTKSAA